MTKPKEGKNETHVPTESRRRRDMTRKVVDDDADKFGGSIFLCIGTG